MIKKRNFKKPILTSNYDKNQIGSQVSLYHNLKSTDWAKEKFDFAFIGINQQTSNKVNNIREKLFELYFHDFHINILDIGDYKFNTLNQALIDIEETIAALLEKNIIPFIISDKKEFTLCQQKTTLAKEHIAKLLFFDSRIDIDLSDKNHKDSYLYKIGLNTTRHHDEVYFLGVQNYFVSPDTVRWIEKMNMRLFRLSSFTEHDPQLETIIRYFNHYSIDLSCIKSADAIGCKQNSPNGFHALQMCQMMRQIGLNENTTSVGIYNYNSTLDINGGTASLIAQMLWCMMQGYAYRIIDTPNIHSKDYTVFNILNKDKTDEFVFIKSTSSNRWWILSIKGDKKNDHAPLQKWIPCSYEDYDYVSNHLTLPKVWWEKTYLEFKQTPITNLC